MMLLPPPSTASRCGGVVTALKVDVFDVTGISADVSSRQTSHVLHAQGTCTHIIIHNYGNNIIREGTK